MDWDRIEGNWKQTKGKIKEKWGQLTDDDLNQIDGKRDQFEGDIEQRYGQAKDMVRKDVRRLVERNAMTLRAGTAGVPMVKQREVRPRAVFASLG